MLILLEIESEGFFIEKKEIFPIDILYCPIGDIDVDSFIHRLYKYLRW
jgi:hypothetical protein